MQKKIQDIVKKVFTIVIKKGFMPDVSFPKAHHISVPKFEAHGDFSSNIALLLGSVTKIPPKEIAQAFYSILKEDPFFEKVEVAGPGFLNFFVAPQVWQENLKEMHLSGERLGETEVGAGKRILLEFVSANPTGPLHVGHGRGAAVGDSLARILRASGFSVETEYYINDVGNQMNTLGASVYFRYQQHFGKDVDFPKDHYQGEYIKDIARKIAKEKGKDFLDVPLEECLSYFRCIGQKSIFDSIKKDLEDFGVEFDNWFSEASLHEKGYVEKAITKLEKKGFIYKADDALWFKTTSFGDEKDRVVRRSNGELTYFASDIAYHRNKLDRDYNLLVDIWGADHHGYVPRVTAAVEAMGYNKKALKVLLVQFVTLIQGGKSISMSTRSGEFVTLRDVIDEVGKDAARFIFLTRKCDSHLDFDIDLAKSQSQENPVYYVQYAHARLASIFKNAKEQGVELPKADSVDTSLLNFADDLKFLKKLDAFSDVVAESALALEPHRVSFYLTELAGFFHGYYTRHRFLSENVELTRVRLFLAMVAKNIFKKGLELLGVSAPEQM